MLLCQEQKREIIIEGTKICISDKAANTHYMMHTMPVTANEIHMYFNAYSNGNVKSILVNNTADELSTLLTKLIAEETQDFLRDRFDNFWASVPH